MRKSKQQFVYNELVTETIRPPGDMKNWYIGPFARIFFFIFGFWCTEYAIVLTMTSSYVTELRNVDWELFLLYSEGLVKPEREGFLWAEVDRLEALISLES